MIKPTLISLIAASAITTAVYSSWTDAGSEVAVKPLQQTSAYKPCLEGPILISISPRLPSVQTPTKPKAPETETSSPSSRNADALTGALIVGIGGLAFLVSIFSQSE